MLGALQMDDAVQHALSRCALRGGVEHQWLQRLFTLKNCRTD